MTTLGQLLVQTGRSGQPGGRDGRVFLFDRPVMRAGRSPENDLLLAGALVSARHAEFRFDEKAGRMSLTDLDSLTGTFVDRVRLLPHQPRPLSHGDVLRIGDHFLVYTDAPAEAINQNPTDRLNATDWPVDWPDLATPTRNAGLKQPLTPCKRPPPKDEPLDEPKNELAGYLQYLPMMFHENNFLRRFLRIFETIWEPLEQRQDLVALYFDPRTCPARFLSWMAEWFGMHPHAGWSEARLRALLAEGIEVYRWQGTRYGLERMIEACAGVKAEVLDAPRQPFVFQVRLDPMPAGDDLEFIRTLIRDFKPAHTDCILLTDRVLLEDNAP